MSKSFSDYKKTFKSNDYLLPSLQRYVMRKSIEDSANSTRRTDIMHPSEMCKPDWCPRKDFYRITLGPRKDAGHSFQTELVFAEGHAIHAKFQNWIRGMGILYGKWQCRSCKEVWVGTSPQSCDSCQSTNISYKEIPLVSEELMIAGHADGAVLDGKEWFDVDEPFLIEIKSVGVGTVRMENPTLFDQYSSGELTLDNLWMNIKRPFTSHIRQATLYCWMGSYKKMVFLYECKWNQQVKEFVVTPNFDHIAWILDSAEDVANGVRTGTAPERPGWASQTHKSCKACPYVKECWGTNGISESANVGVSVAASAKRNSVVRGRKPILPSSARNS